jgi:hypothetical protein
MYLWKYWRESRIAFGAGILVLAALTALSFRMGFDSANVGGSSAADAANFQLIVASSPWALFAWFMGSFGVGRNLGEGVGSYLLTRPRRRSWFVWRDWTFGLALIAILVILSKLLAPWHINWAVHTAGNLFRGQFRFRDLAALGPTMQSIGLNAPPIFLFCGLVFCVVYLSTILIRSALGNMLGAGVLVGYVILAALVQHYYRYKLWDLLMRIYVSPVGHPQGIGLADHLGVSMVIRAAVLLLFPIAAQLILNSRDI